MGREPAIIRQSVAVRATPGSGTMRSGLGRIMKVALIVVGIAALSLSAAIALTDPNPSTLPLRAWRWLAARSSKGTPARTVATPAAPRGPEPPYSDINFD